METTCIGCVDIILTLGSEGTQLDTDRLICLSVSLSVCPSVSLSICPSLCLAVRVAFWISMWFPWLRTAHTSVCHRVKSPESQYNLFVYLSGHRWAFFNFCIYINLWCGVQRRDAYISSAVQLSLYSLCVCLYISMSSLPRQFLEVLCVDHNCAQHMRPQAMGSNPLSSRIICLSVYPSVRLSVYGSFVFFCIGFQCEVLLQEAFIPTQGS